jgi:starvation-inducible DNA-binding protein
MTHRHTTQHDIDREAVGIELQSVLVALIDLWLIGKYASFRSLHLELDHLIEAWRDAAGLVGERIAVLGGFPDGRAKTVPARSWLPTLTEGPQPDRALVGSLAAILAEAVRLICARIDRIEVRDPMTADLLHSIVAILEEQLSMIRAQAG